MNIGDVILDYEIIEYLDEGGMGTVFKVNKNGVDYALKSCTSSDAEDIKRFRREIRLMENIKHENVIPVLDNADVDDTPCFIMPLCEKSLSSAVRDGLTDEQKFEYARQFCEGMKAIHNAGEVHRDVKPNNALILNNKVMVSDLGLGKFVDRDSTTLTPTTAYMGTEGYMSPEVYRDYKAKDSDKRSDIYSIGCLLYFIFSDGESPKYIDPTKIKADIYAIVNKCKKISPPDRYQDVTEIIEALNICEQTRKAPLTVKDLISQYRRGVNDQAFYDKLYNHLLTDQNDLANFIYDLRIIGNQRFELLLNYKKNEVSNLISLLLNTFENKDYDSYSIKWEDVDVLVEKAHLLLKATKSVQEKQDLLNFAITSSLEYNRYPAMREFDAMLRDLSQDEIRAMGVFFTSNKDEINAMKQYTTMSIPPAIATFLK